MQKVVAILLRLALVWIWAGCCRMVLIIRWPPNSKRMRPAKVIQTSSSSSGRSISSFPQVSSSFFSPPSNLEERRARRERARGEIRPGFTLALPWLCPGSIRGSTLALSVALLWFRPGAVVSSYRHPIASRISTIESSKLRFICTP